LCNNSGRSCSAAFSTPGGQIFISRGLIELTSSEDMLAAVIAHELANIQLMHDYTQINNDRLIQQLAQERFRISQSLTSDTGQLFPDTVNEIVQTLLFKLITIYFNLACTEINFQHHI